MIKYFPYSAENSKLTDIMQEIFIKNMNFHRWCEQISAYDNTRLVIPEKLKMYMIYYS